MVYGYCAAVKTTTETKRMGKHLNAAVADRIMLGAQRAHNLACDTKLLPIASPQCWTVQVVRVC